MPPAAFFMGQGKKIGYNGRRLQVKVLRSSPRSRFHALTRPEQWRILADDALACDIVFTQSLFHFGHCNTEQLRQVLKQRTPEAGGRLILFSSPHFEAYFPDVIVLRRARHP